MLDDCIGVLVPIRQKTFAVNPSIKASAQLPFLLKNIMSAKIIISEGFEYNKKDRNL
ncbi:hypothetical protein AGMMS49974_07190 [Deltaproteobacteria bacterium]|nr:hypothetical protein AGMMS49925_02390 [Deltaproteobacteria bacterium]GHU95519.1 hypothetical protein AGMMS49974_07190 [Deltaproteobacteria bacterium]GHU97514.1 hypothetical protein AGMMS50248_02010 [Deltaproteobacteria bacterium]